MSDEAKTYPFAGMPGAVTVAEIPWPFDESDLLAVLAGPAHRGALAIDPSGACWGVLDAVGPYVALVRMRGEIVPFTWSNPG